MLHVRHRLNYSSATDVQVQTRAAGIMRLMGDDLFRAGGFGESVGSRPVTSSTTFEPAAKAIAQAGWKLQNHTDFFADVDFQLAAFQRIHAVIPIDKLRWQLIHCFQTTTAQLQALKDIGVGLDLENERYLDRLMRGGGPQYRQIVDSGIKCGAGTDGSNFAPNNPWLNIYYATTGVNVRGIPENAARRSRGSKALRMWTAGSAYQNFDDDKGVFEVGKVADIAVLSDNSADLHGRQAAQDEVGADHRRRQDRPRRRLPRLRDGRTTTSSTPGPKTPSDAKRWARSRAVLRGRARC